jgi:exopolysaccharide biosynthesis protein
MATTPTPPVAIPRAPTPPRRRKRLRRGWRIAIACATTVVVLAGGVTYWALDRYVIDHVQISDVRAYESQQLAAQGSQQAAADPVTAGVTPSGDSSATGATTSAGGTTSAAGESAVVTGNSYISSDTKITLSTVSTGSGNYTVTYYVADVVVGDATDIRSAFADNEFGQSIVDTTSDIAEQNDAILAINGDYYGFRTTGIEIRNGVIFRDEGAREGLAMYRDGTVKVYDETTTTAQQLVDDGVWNTLSFGPALVEGGQIVSGIDDVEVDTNFGNHSIQGSQPRTAIGLISANHYVFVVVDGRNPGYSNGVTMTGLAQIMQGLGATTTYNLDGGGSSTLYFDGKVVNQPGGSRDSERGVSDIIYVGAS